MSTTPDKMMAAMATMAENLREKTGKTLAQWTAIAKKSGKEKHGELVKWLKADHGLTHGYAGLVARTTFKSDAKALIAAGDDLVADMFAGAKEAMRPVYDKLMKAITAFGGDIEEAPKKGYLSLRRKTQFATLHPATKDRLDVGIKLKGVPPTDRLEAAGSWNGMVTHRVRVGSIAQVDKALLTWVRQAYDGAL